MKIAFLLLLALGSLLLHFNSPAFGESEATKKHRYLDYKTTSLISVIANPEKYKNKKIQITGYFYWSGVSTCMAVSSEHVKDGAIAEFVALSSGPAFLSLLEKNADREVFVKRRISIWGEVIENPPESEEAAFVGNIQRIVIYGIRPTDETTSFGELDLR